MKIRSYSWGKVDISWSVVIEELLHSAEGMGHDICFQSTNGYDGMRYFNHETSLTHLVKQKEMVRSGQRFDLDLTYTFPSNFPQRFLSNSRIKAAIYNYESSIMPPQWAQYYSGIDYVLPSSEYVAKMFIKNGCPSDKIVVVPHGIDPAIFNPSVPRVSISSQKKFKFLCVAEPHVRKQIDRLLLVYAQTFSSKDDVCLVLKTKIFNDETVKKKAPFEQDLRPILAGLKSRFGPSLPEIKIVSSRLPNLASLYNSCDAFALMTASEGWGMPYLEALACDLPVIAPRHGGQLDFLNDNNSILTKCGTRKARPEEQYQQVSVGATVGDPDEGDFAQAMVKLYKNKESIRQRLLPGMKQTASRLTWEAAMGKILELVPND